MYQDSQPTYDPVKRHEYYIRTRQLKGRPTSSSSKSTSTHPTTPSRPSQPPVKVNPKTQKAQARVGRLRSKVKKLQKALSETEAILSQKRQAARKKDKASSDGKTTVKERQASQKYRDTHKAELKAKRSNAPSSSSSSSGSQRKSVADMSVQELSARVIKIRSVLREAKRQLSSASQELGHLAHADLTSDAHVNARFARVLVSRKDSVRMTESDFSGYATRNNLRCSDGRTILADAFKENDGQIVPLLWQHGHDDPTNVLGHVKLENVGDGVRAHAFFNATAKAQHAKEMVKHGDVKWLSIFANNLIEKVTNGVKAVVHGNIREVSLVLAGANPGAVIENVSIAHSDGEVETFYDEAVITTGLDIELMHADNAGSTATVDSAAGSGEKTIQDILDTLNEEQANAVDFLLSQALTVESAVQHSDTGSDEVAGADNEGTGGSDETAGTEGEVTAGGEEDSEAANADANAGDTGTEEQAGTEDADGVEGSGESDQGGSSSDGSDEGDTGTDTGTEAGDDAVQHGNINQEDNSMTHNVFDQAKQGGATAGAQVTLQHDDIKRIVELTVKHGSMKEAVQDFVTNNGIMVGGQLQHGIENIEYLFPDAKLLETSPQFLSRRMEWVDKVLGGVRKSPFSRVKTVVADITAEEARARGYIKGNMKKEEFFTLLKRETTPQTVYKKQKLDRDDVLDIVDLDVVAWMKAEMKVMLDEEIAGAILVGDGRSAGDEDKIREDRIRPIATDAELYVTTANVNLDDANSNIDELVDAVIANRKYYKGTGSPTFYTTEDIISAFLVIKDNFGRRIYTTLDDVKAVLRVADIVPVEILERVPDVVGIMVNLTDYTLGADRGGQATMFDDFDIDYNKLRYLIETRVSGALTLPKSAIVFRKVAAADVLVTPTDPTFDGTTVTVPTVTGVTYKNADTNATLTTAAPVTLAAGETLNVQATANSGYYFANNVEDQWTFTNPA